MHRWVTFFVLPLFLLVQFRPLTANAFVLATKHKQLSPADSALATLTPLVTAADLIVRGQVTAHHSFWDADHSLIESDVTIKVAYTFVGHSQRTLTIRTVGGFLAAEGIGLVSMHEAAWTVGEEILAFAYRQGTVWRMVGGATGKFVVQQQMLINRDLALAQPLSGVLPALVELIKQRGLQAEVPTIWRHLVPPAPSTPTLVTAPQSDKRRWTTPHATATFTINLNTQQIGDDDGIRADFQRAVIAAATSWGQVPGADFTLTYAGETQATQTGYNGINEVLFMHKGQQERAAAAQVWFTADGTIVEADIWINDDYVWNATGTPAADEVDLQSALVHEFGHWLILGHCADSHAVMFAKLSTGVVKRELQQSDIIGIRAIYPR